MFALPQQWQWQPLRLPSHVHTCRHPHPSVIRATVTTPSRPHKEISIKPHVHVGRTSDDSRLRSTWSHRAWVATGCAAVFVPLAKAVFAAADSGTWVEPSVAGFLGYVAADFGTGVYHWAIDNYGDASTPLVGPQIEAFQGHHKWPWTITRRDFANNLQSIARATAFTLVPFDLLGSHAVLHAFVAVCSGCVLFSQQFHAWAHSTKSKLPPLVVALQDAGVLISRAKHAAHHRPPYNNNYCIVSGVWNQFLDDRRFFEAMEMIVFFKFGVRPRSWHDPDDDWMEDSDAAS